LTKELTNCIFKQQKFAWGNGAISGILPEEGASAMRLKDFFLRFFIFILLAIFNSGNGYAVINEGGPDISKGTVQEKGKEGRYKEGELLVKFRPNTSEEKKDGLHKKHGSKKIKEFPSLRIQNIKLKKEMTVEEAVALYSAEPDVEYAEPNLIVSILTTPNDPRFGELWGLHNTGQTGGTSDADIDAPEAWDISIGSSDVVVAVIDTGVDYGHEDLAANMWTNPLEIPGNGIDDDGNGYIDDIYGIDAINNDSDPFDDNGHGTHVSGTIGAVGDNGIGVAGVNWDVKIIGCKFLGSSGWGYTDDAVECLQYIKGLRDRGVNIIVTSNSWGGGDYSQSLYDAINAQREILFMAAAGNSGADNDSYDSYPANYYLPNLLSIAATDHSDALASFSEYGRRSVHVGAPGVSILSSFPGNSYSSMSGTSMATPHVSGLAALLKASDPSYDWIDIRNLILSGGDNIQSLDNITITGRRINAFGSLACVDSPLLAVLKAPESLTVGIPETLAVLSINCELPVGPVTVTLSTGEVINLMDDGIVPDLAAGDGIFSAAWTPAKDIEKLTFSSPGGTEIIVIPPLSITTGYLPSRPVGMPYSQTLSATGGLPPYTWSIISGGLPDGLTLNSSTGEISGTPTTTGKSSFTVQVAESYQTTSAKELSITIYNENALDPLWAKTYSNSNGAEAVAIDGSGNVYVTGVTGFYTDYLTVKYDSSGNVLWAQTYNSGNNDFARGIAVDGSGNIYVTGYSYNGSNYDVLTVKYDPSGNVLWTKTYDSGINDYARGVAADGSGYIYVAGSTFAGPKQGSQNNILTIKYDTAGAMIWDKTFDAGRAELAFGIAVDGENNIYMSGVQWSRSNPGDFVTIKADQDGNALWTAIYDSGDEDYATGVAVDAGGNVYVTGSFYNGKYYDYLTVKYDSNGEALWNRIYSGNGDDYAEGIAVYENNIYVTGSSWNGLNYDALTIKYSPEGVDEGVKIYDSGDNDYAYAITAEENGNIYVAGYDNGFLIIKYIDHPHILNTSLLIAAVNISYSQTLIALGGLPPYTWSIISGGLPDGLTLNSSTGVISGTPAALGTFNFTVQVTDSASHTDTKDLSITVRFISINPSSLPDGTRGVAYSQTLVAAGGQPLYTWSVSSGSLPTGLTLDNSTGIISGTPTATGTYDFTVQVTDANETYDTWWFSIVICDPLIITTSTLSYGITGVAYSQTLAASGGKTPYTWSITITSGDLPPGLALNGSTGEIYGTPTAAGTFNFTVQVTDANYSTDTRDFSISVYDLLIITTSSLSDGATSIAYSETLTATGGKAPYTWSISSGGLPPGLALNSSTGEISGTPTAAGIFNFSVQVTDANYSTATKDLSISIIVYEPLAIATSSLPDGRVEVYYRQMLSAMGGLEPYTWSIISGSLPDGLSFYSPVGEIYGTPTAAGTFNFTVQVTDAASGTSSKELSITIYDPLRITTPSLSDGVIGNAYSQTLTATGGSPPYTWSWSAWFSSLPPGLALNSSTGEIYGTPTEVGYYGIAVQVTDALGTASMGYYYLTIWGPVRITTSGMEGSRVCRAYTKTLTAEGNFPPFTWSIVSGSLPEGLTLNSSTGEISGTPTEVGQFNFSVRVTDTESNTDEKTLGMLAYFWPWISGHEGCCGDIHLQPFYSVYVPDGGILQIPAMSTTEDLTFDQAKSVVLEGGYDCDFTDNPSYTTINGNMTNSYGTTTLEKIILNGTLTITGGTVIPNDMILE